MRKTTLMVTTGILVLVLFAAACTFGPPPSCGDTIGGTADTVQFDRYFSGMTLISQATGQAGAPGDDGPQFAQGEDIAIQIESIADVTVRACVQPRTGAKDLPFDQSQTFTTGQGVFPIGSLAPGSYVIRVIVDDTLVRNFPFVVK